MKHRLHVSIVCVSLGFFALGCGTSDTLGPEPATESISASDSGDSSMPAGDTWVSGSIPADAESATQLGNSEGYDEDDGFVGAGIEIWSGGSLELQGSESLTGFGEYAIVEVDYAADEEVILCYVTWPITSVQKLNTCRDCDWAFEVQTGRVEYHDNSQGDCQANGFEPDLFELALQNIGVREGNFLMIEEDDWEPVGEATYLSTEDLWEFELFVGDDD